MNKLYAVSAALVLSLGLAGCGNSASNKISATDKSTTQQADHSNIDHSTMDHSTMKTQYNENTVQ